MSDKRGREDRGQDEGARGGGRARKAKKKIGVMDQSKQTTAERRQLRHEQRALRSKVIEEQSAIADPTKSTMEDLTMANAKLFERTRYPREAAQDGETMRLIAEAASQQVKKVASGTVGVDLDDFLNKLRTVFTPAETEFNWAKFGASASLVYLSTPEGGGFMMGPLDKPAKGPRQQNRRKNTDTVDSAEVLPESVEAADGKKNSKQTKDQTQMRISQMKAHEEKKGDGKAKKDMFETLLNPKSFTQTVENIFDFSFFVKSGEGSISLDEETKLPLVSFNEKTEGGGSTGTSTKQWLMSFTPADFRELRELYGMTQSNFEHRDEGPTSDYYDPLVHGNRESNRQ